MAPSRRSKMFRALQHLSVETEEQRIVRSTVNDPPAASVVQNQHAGTHLGAPTDTMPGSSLVPSSGVEFQTGCLAASLDVHQPMDIQQNRTDLDVLSLAEFDPTQPLEGIDIGAAYLQVLPPEFGIQSWESNRASRFQPYRSRATAQSRNPVSNRVSPAPTATDGLPGWPGQDSGISRLPELEPLTEAEELDMLQQLFAHEQRQSMENAYSLSSWHQQLHKPNHLGEPIQAVNFDTLSHSQPSPSLPLPGMIPYSASHVQSMPYGHHQPSPQQQLIDLDLGMQQLVSSAPFHSSLSSEPCAMELPPYSNPIIIPAIVPDIVEPAPTVNITPFDELAQPPANTALPTSPRIPNRSTNSISTNHVEFAARVVAAWRSRGRGRGRGNRLPQRRGATGGKRRQTVRAPTTDGTMVVPARTNRNEVILSQMVTQRQNHILSERQRRIHMNQLYATIRNLLPSGAIKTRSDNATVVTEMINYIKRCQNELAMLEPQLRQQPRSAVRNTLPPNDDTNVVVSLINGLTCVDHTRDALALTAVTTRPAVESDSCLASFLGTNVAINVCGHNCSLTISSPQDGPPGLLDRIVTILMGHHVEVLCVTIVTGDNTYVYSLQCQASPDAELLRNDLHTALQSVVNDFASSSSSQHDYA